MLLAIAIAMNLSPLLSSTESSRREYGELVEKEVKDLRCYVCN